MLMVSFHYTGRHQGYVLCCFLVRFTLQRRDMEIKSFWQHLHKGCLFITISGVWPSLDDLPYRFWLVDTTAKRYPCYSTYRLMQRSVISLPTSKQKLGPICCKLDMGTTLGT